MMKEKCVLMLPLLCAVLYAATPWAATIHEEDFENPAWVSGMTDNWQNDVTRVGTGDNGIASSGGVGHGTVGVSSTRFTRFGGYSSVFGSGFSVCQDIYLDPTWDLEQGFDWSVAVSDQAGAHRRDFIWRVGVVDEIGLVVNASNNTDFGFNSFKLTTENSGNYYTVASAGWYTFESVFYDAGGLLFVDYNLYNSGGGLVHSITRGGNPADVIATDIGGNRYGWMTYNNVDRLAIDNTLLKSSAPIPEPTTLSLLALGLTGMVMRRSRKK